jgi:hypothetical protein
VFIDTVPGPAGLPESAVLVIDGAPLAVSPIAHAPVVVDGPDGQRSRLARALCRLGGGVGETGVGWGDWLLPGPGADQRA